MLSVANDDGSGFCALCCRNHADMRHENATVAEVRRRTYGIKLDGSRIFMIADKKMRWHVDRSIEESNESKDVESTIS
jgi:hypothetical protein